VAFSCQTEEAEKENRNKAVQHLGLPWISLRGRFSFQRTGSTVRVALLESPQIISQPLLVHCLPVFSVSHLSTASSACPRAFLDSLGLLH
jgi:hypothetical protein